MCGGVKAMFHLKNTRELNNGVNERKLVRAELDLRGLQSEGCWRSGMGRSKNDDRGATRIWESSEYI